MLVSRLAALLPTSVKLTLSSMLNFKLNSEFELNYKFDMIFCILMRIIIFNELTNSLTKLKTPAYFVILFFDDKC